MSPMVKAFILEALADPDIRTALREALRHGWECFDECFQCGCGRYDTPALMPYGEGFICEECSKNVDFGGKRQ